MQLLKTGQQVTYVAAPSTEGGKTSKKKAVILEVMSQATGNAPAVARLDLTPRNANGEAANPKEAPIGHHTAIALSDESDEPKENTFSIKLADEKAAPAPVAATTTPAAAK